jgi:transposase
MTLLELFCDVDDFCQQYAPQWEQTQVPALTRKRGRKPRLSMSEMMTIVIHFHQIRYRDFKTYYTCHVAVYLRQEFPGLVSYNRFVELMSRTVMPLMLYLNSQRGACTGLSFVDSTPLKVCDNHRIHTHKVFQGFAQRGKSSMGWFFGFKLHLVINEQGELLAFHLTPGNVDDRQPVPVLCQHLFGKLFADKGYISQKLFDMLLTQQVHLVTKLRKNMKNRLMPLADALLLRKRALIETVNDQLKNISHIEHSRHRSVNNFVVNLFAGLIAYTLQPKKPSLCFDRVPLPAIVG